MEKREFSFNAVIYKSHTIAILVAIALVIGIVFFPSFIIFKYIWIEWDNFNIRLSQRLWRYVIVAGPLSYLWGRLLRFFFIKNIFIIVEENVLSFSKKNDNKTIFKINLNEEAVVEISTREKNGESTTTHQIWLSNSHIPSLYLVSPKKINKDHEIFAEFIMWFDNYLKEKNVKLTDNYSGSMYKDKIIYKINKA